MHESGSPRFDKFELVNVAEVDGRWYYTQQVSGILGTIRSQAQIGKEAHAE
jgi:hypothetical protein